MKGPSAISILFPILAMGLPISDTAMAIFRRWVRNLPLSAADRRHVHHLLIGLGLNPRQAALLLYSFSGFLCGAVLLGVALRSEFLALVLGISGCLAFLVVVTSRRDELTNLRGDLQARMTRGRQERQAAKLTWEGIQRIELCVGTGCRLSTLRWRGTLDHGPRRAGTRARPGVGHRVSLPGAARSSAGRASGVVSVHRVKHVGVVDSGDRDQYGRAADRGVLDPARRASRGDRRHLPNPRDETSCATTAR